MKGFTKFILGYFRPKGLIMSLLVRIESFERNVVHTCEVKMPKSITNNKLFRNFEISHPVLLIFELLNLI